MADNAPRKTGLYERPMGRKGLMIGIVVLLALLVLAIIFFSSRRAGAAAFGAGGGHAGHELRVVIPRTCACDWRVESTTSCPRR
jgi:hypothetical protein